MTGSGGDQSYWSTHSDNYLNTNYRHGGCRIHRTRHRLILDLLEGRTGKILDAGCGPGEMVADLKIRGWQVFGLDLSFNMLLTARGNLLERGGTEPNGLFQGAIERLPFRDGVFDFVVCEGVMPYQRDDKPALSEFWRVLKPGGRLLATVSNRASPSGFVIWNLTRLAGRRPSSSNWYRLPFRRHWPWQWDAAVRAVGFEITERHFYHFDFLPESATALIAFMSRAMPWLCGAYLVHATKPETGGSPEG